MVSVEQRLRILARQPLGSAARILSGALTHAESSEVEQLAAAALRNGQPAAIAAVIEQLHRALSRRLEGGPQLDRRLRSIDSLHLSDALHRVVAARRTRSCRNAIEVVAARADPALAPLLPPLLHWRDDDVAEPAAAALLQLTVTTLGATGRRTLAPREQRDVLDEALTIAAAGFRSHRRKAALLAAAISLARPAPHLSAAVEQRDSALAASLRAVPGWMEQPLVVRNLIRWLGEPALRRGVINWLPRLPPEDVATLLRDGHLLRTPQRRAALRQVSAALSCAPRPDSMASLALSAQHHVPHFISRLNLSPRVRVDRLAACAALESSTARWRAVEALHSEPASRAAAPVRLFCRDGVAAIARSAVHCLRHWGELEITDAEALHSAGHVVTARRVAARQSQREVPVFRRHFMELSSVARSAAARRLLDANRGGLLAVLRELLLDPGEPQRQIETMKLVRRLGLVRAVEDPLIELAAAADAQVAATSVSCLGDAPTRRTLEVLRVSLRHPNPRVVANGIEAMGRAAPGEAAEVSRRLVQSPANRARGNALRALLNEDLEAGERELRRMLADAWPLHRISAIWVARRARSIAALDDLARLADERQHPEVQIRAAAALRFLAAEDGGRGRPGRVVQSAAVSLNS